MVFPKIEHRDGQRPFRPIGGGQCALQTRRTRRPLGPHGLGVGLAVAAVAAFTQFALIDGLASAVNALPFIGWEEWAETSLVLLAVAPVLTVVPTLLLTRKYLRL